MAKYSRTEKYEELRNKLQNNSDEQSLPQTKELASYENRLKRIQDENYEEDKVVAESHDPIHARRKQYLEEVEETPFEDTNPTLPLFGKDASKTSTFDNEYLDEYIKEIKEYNRAKGRVDSTDTELNILMALKDDKPSVPTKPYPDEEPVVKPTVEQTIDLPSITSLREKHAKEEVAPTPKEETVDIPSFAVEPQVEELPPVEENTSTLTKEDIAAEVQSLIRDQDTTQVQQDDEDSLDFHLAAERTARQQLLNETTQMRAQLDDYEDNLTEVSDQMNRTNRVLNVVLIVLIIALLVVLGVVIYWILSLRGVL